ncbi:MAG: TlpA family protein disulfide reductase [Muribaculaceae bacterium]|nr:TlpA family protein disulfide reductase [Muribaculaceae bacterium]
MKRIIISGLGLVAAATMTYADIHVKVAPTVSINEFPVEYSYLTEMVKTRAERPQTMKETKIPENGEFTIATLQDGASQYAIMIGDREYILVYTMPGEELTVDIESVGPLSYKVSGSQLMEDISTLATASGKILDDYRTKASGETPDVEELEQIGRAYDNVFKDYITANPESVGVPYAILHLEGEDFLNAYSAMTEAAAKSPLAIFLEPQKERVEHQVAAEKKKAELQSGDVMAPDFTYKDAQGKEISLSDFRGKWVIIDFWGTWCPWCIKGFPELKKAYAEYQPELEILGVACNDDYNAWLNGLKKYDLPWVNVYNPEEKGGKLLEDYAVEGFPTKAIINPEGKIVNITTGHNPAFFEILKEKMGK